MQSDDELAGKSASELCEVAQKYERLMQDMHQRVYEINRRMKSLIDEFDLAPPAQDIEP